jgi:hypothetical protein
MYLLAGFTAFVALLCAVFDPKELPGESSFMSRGELC